MTRGRRAFSKWSFGRERSSSSVRTASGWIGAGGPGRGQLNPRQRGSRRRKEWSASPSHLLSSVPRQERDDSGTSPSACQGVATDRRRTGWVVDEGIGHGGARTDEFKPCRVPDRLPSGPRTRNKAPHGASSALWLTARRRDGQVLVSPVRVPASRVEGPNRPGAEGAPPGSSGLVSTWRISGFPRTGKSGRPFLPGKVRRPGSLALASDRRRGSGRLDGPSRPATARRAQGSHFAEA
jgi:hypothetical protein